MKIIDKFRSIMCMHRDPSKIRIDNWFYSHGPHTDEPRFIVVQAYCNKCGKYFTYDITSTDEMREFMNRHSEKRVY